MEKKKSGDSSSEDDLGIKAIDQIVASAAGIAGAIPIIGPTMSELLFTTVPGLRQQRIVDYARLLEIRLTSLEKEVREKLLNIEANLDLLETGTWASAKAISSDRIEYIANLVSNGLGLEETDVIRNKRLLTLLDQVDDDAFVLLKAYGDSYASGTRDAWENVKRPAPVHMGSGQKSVDENNLYQAGKAQLVRIGLLSEQLVLKDKMPVMDPPKKAFKTRIKISSLGRLLLRQVGQPTDFDKRHSR